jgi:hypothetical protein
MDRGIPYKTLAMVWLRDLVTDLSLQMPRIDPRPKHVILMVDKEAMTEVLLQVLQVSTVHTIPSVFHIFHSSVTNATQSSKLTSSLNNTLKHVRNFSQEIVLWTRFQTRQALHTSIRVLLLYQTISMTKSKLKQYNDTCLS